MPKIYFKPLFFVVIYWLFFLMQAIFFTSFYVSKLAVSHFLIMLLCLSIGYAYYYLIFQHLHPIKKHKAFVFNRKKIFFSIFLILFSLLLIGFKLGAFGMSFKSYFLFMRGSSDGAYYNPLDTIYEGNIFFSVIVKFFLYPLFICCQSIACSISDKDKSDFYIFILSLGLSVVYAYIFQSGFPLGSFFSFLLISFFLSKKKKQDRMAMIKKISLILVSIAALFYLNIRTGGNDIISNVEKYFLSYRTIGYSFYSVKLDDPGSILHEPSYGVSILGEFGRISATLLRRAGLSTPKAITANQDSMRELNDFVYIGTDTNGEPQTVNAFGTMLFDMYRDLKEVGIIIISCILGFILASVYKKSYYSEPHLACFFILIHAIIAGNTMSQFARGYVWLAIIYARFALF